MVEALCLLVGIVVGAIVTRVSLGPNHEKQLLEQNERLMDRLIGLELSEASNHPEVAMHYINAMAQREAMRSRSEPVEPREADAEALHVSGNLE